MGLLFVLGVFLICWIYFSLDDSGVLIMIDASIMFFYGFMFFCFLVVLCNFGCMLVLGGDVVFAFSFVYIYV